jgi:NO-binding membrane sensor protein with MHYT domain
MTVEKCEEHSGCTADIENLKESNKEIWEAIKKIQNRLPVWATAVISLLTFLFGCSITYAGLVVKIMEMKK